eukprot:TRINITY_DN1308_c0_g2_i1.p1 TRINITY_DN1308_c0_g2~~TRINITY_DN1308_c0_g2_i1.p1  ORF type:complete len:259 (+),score=24.07 TRINITY_DN1308_c0_g2_i1:68-844(+)
MNPITLVSLLLLVVLAATTDVYAGMRIKCGTTAGDFVVEMTPSRGPLGAQRFVDLVEDEFFTEIPLFRVVPGFLVQYGIPGIVSNKERHKKWIEGRIKDDPHPEGGRSQVDRGDISFAGAGADSRTTQVFIAYKDKSGLGGALHETPFGKVVEGMEYVDKFYSAYGDTAPFGKNGPDQGKMWSVGNPYLKEHFPKLDYVTRCTVIPAATSVPETLVPSTPRPQVQTQIPTNVLVAGSFMLLVVMIVLRRVTAKKVMTE